MSAPEAARKDPARPQPASHGHPPHPRPRAAIDSAEWRQGVPPRDPGWPLVSGGPRVLPPLLSRSSAGALPADHPATVAKPSPTPASVIRTGDLAHVAIRTRNHRPVDPLPGITLWIG